MILHLTDAEAFAISRKLQEKKTGIDPGTIDLKDGVGEGVIGEGVGSLVDIQALDSAIAKIQAGMIKSDEKLSRTLNTAIASLTSSGFDVSQIAALQSAKDKAEEHNAKKYLKGDRQEQAESEK
tara:strand:- start:294 stop:665 length:372 start_codon:yes stop_codon:yes gene_type:complete